MNQYIFTKIIQATHHELLERHLNEYTSAVTNEIGIGWVPSMFMNVNSAGHTVMLSYGAMSYEQMMKLKDAGLLPNGVTIREHS